MVGSQFILINKNGRRTLLNTAHVTAVYDVDVLLTAATRPILWEYSPEQEVAYIVRVEQPDGPSNFLFTKKEERDEMLDKLIEAISPSTAIDCAPGLPHTWPELAYMAPTGKHRFKGKEYDTKEEFMQAVEEEVNKATEAAMEAQRQNQAAATPPPAPRALRKTYTRKPKEPGQ